MILLCHRMWCIKIFFFFPRFSHKFVLSLRGGLFDSELKSLSNDVRFIYETNFWGEKISLLYSCIVTSTCPWTKENPFFCSRNYVPSSVCDLFDWEFNSASNNVRFIFGPCFWREKLSFQWFSWAIVCDAWRSFFSSFVFHISLSEH